MGMGQGSGSIVDKLFEVVGSETVEEGAYSITFPFDFREGTYLVISDPVMTSELAAQQEQGQSLYSLTFSVIGISTKTIRNNATILALKSPTSTSVDWWTAGATINDGSITLQFAAGRHLFQFMPGFTYYLCRIRGL